MPDRWEFDHLGESGVVRCIWCQYTSNDEEARERHYKRHQKDRDAAKEASLREKMIADKLVD